MGAIVGGTFAAGLTPAKLQEAVLKADWNEIFRDQPPRDEIAVRRKIDDYKTLFKPEFGVKDGGLALPKGVIAGVSIESFFRGLTTPAYDIEDFRKLPIPFRAMATDIETGQSVVLDHGSVAQAMRASMSVPGALAPVEIDGKLLVDGGIANNLPIDEARKLCGDVVIAVNISTPPLKRSEITSALTRRRPARQFPRPADRERPVEEHDGPRRADRAGPGRHFGGQVRPFRGCDQDRRGSDAQARRFAQALQPAARAVRGVALEAGRGRQAARHGGRDPLRRARAHQSGGAARAGRDQARRAAVRSEARPRSAPHLRTRRLREHRLPRSAATPARARSSSSRREKSWGPDYLRFGLGPRQRLPGRPTSSTPSSNIARPGSTASAPSGRRRRRSDRTRSCRPSSTSRSWSRAAGSSRPSR